MRTKYMFPFDIKGGVEHVTGWVDGVGTTMKRRGS